MAKTIDPPMHTAEHLLNRTIVRRFGCGRCFSAHIEKKKSKCDYHFERPLKAEEIRQIEAMVNEIVAANLPVTESYQDRKAAESDFDLARLPDATEERIRIVSIGGYDTCPCIGPHVSFTGEVGRFNAAFIEDLLAEAGDEPDERRRRASDLRKRILRDLPWPSAPPKPNRFLSNPDNNLLSLPFLKALCLNRARSPLPRSPSSLFVKVNAPIRPTGSIADLCAGLVLNFAP